MSQHLPTIAAELRLARQAALRAEMAAGASQPWLFPHVLLGPIILPVLWMSLPHVRAKTRKSPRQQRSHPGNSRSSWLASPLAKWTFVSVCAALDFRIILGRTTSTRPVMAYGAGMLACWGLMTLFALVVAMEPQKEAARVVRRRRRGRREEKEKEGREDGNGSGSGNLIERETGNHPVNGIVAVDTHEKEEGKHVNHGNGRPGQGGNSHGHARLLNAQELRERARNSGRGVSSLASPSQEIKSRNAGPVSLAENERNGNEHDNEDKNGSNGRRVHHEYEHYWEAFPTNAPFLHRLNWAFDLFISLRGVGWNWTIPSVPHPPAPPLQLRPRQPADIHATPLRSRQGSARHATRSGFLAHRCRRFLLLYIVLDLLLVLLVHDPYFVFGPDHIPPDIEPTPALLRFLPGWGLYLCRIYAFFAFVILALTYFMDMHDLLHYFLISRALPVRDEPWQHPSFFGNFGQVLDRGMAGFWGAWWHQAFRNIFSAPADFLIKKGYVAPRSAAAAVAKLVFPFLFSGLLHASCAHTMPGSPAAWMPLLFFGLSGLGMALQLVLCHVLRDALGAVPRTVRRSGNLVFVSVWLTATGWLFADDMANAGFFLCEMSPVSFAALAGLGAPGDSWFRPEFAHWHSGQHWWDTGLAL